MTLMDPIGDMFTRIRNGQMRLLNTIDVPASNFRLQILEVLKSEGYITNYFIEKKDNNKKNLTIFVNDKNLENGSFLESILAKLSFPYPNIFIIRKKIKSALPMGILFFKLFFSRTIIIGDILSPWMGLIAKYFFFEISCFCSASF